ESRDALEERLLRAKVDDVRVRDLAARVAFRAIVSPKQDHSIGVIKRWRLEQHRINDAEDRRVSANPKREREHSNNRKTRPLDQAPDSKSNVFKHRSYS